MRMSEDSIVVWNVELVSHTRTWNRYSIADTKDHFPIFSVRSITRTFFYPKVRYGREIFSEAPRGLMSFQVLERWKIKTRCLALTCQTACRRRKQGLSPTAKKTIRFALLFEPYGSKFFLLGRSPIESKKRLCLTHLVGELDAHQFGAWRHLTFLPSALSWLSLFFLIIVFSFVFLKIMFFVFPHYCL